MADIMSKSARSRLMARVRTRHTAPERRVRACLREMGISFYLHRRDLPGSPDLVLPKYKAVMFVHGCFWHRHVRCKKATMPKSRVAFWQSKFDANILRDRRHAGDWHGLANLES